MKNYVLNRNHVRVLVAGGGTGFDTVALGHKLNNTDAEIVYMDFSMTSLEIAQRRARAMGLKNIIWVQSWIEGLNKKGLGTFDNIQCSGVLHHLKSPSVGLNVLKDLSMLNGGMDLMVYALKGRIAVYIIQLLMREINLSTLSMNSQLRNCKNVLNSFPVHNCFLMNAVGANRTSGDIGN